MQKSLNYINSEYQHIVDIDLKGFFDEVDHCLLMNLLYRKVKCPVTMQLIRRWLRAPIWINGKLTKRRKGYPQCSPISPLLSNIVLHELDEELEKRVLRFVRYADDFSIYCNTKTEAQEKGNSINGFTLSIRDLCFALCITPGVPVILNFNRVANFRAFKSSRNNKTSSNSVANAIALASP